MFWFVVPTDLGMSLKSCTKTLKGNAESFTWSSTDTLSSDVNICLELFGVHGRDNFTKIPKMALRTQLCEAL